MERHLPDPPASTSEAETHLRCVIRDDAYYGAACIAVGDLAGTHIHAGDVVIYEGDPGRALCTGCRWHRLPRSEFAILGRALDAGALFIASGGALSRFMRYLAHPAARRGRDGTSPVYVARPLRSRVSQPIVATSDDAAIFELLAGVGGRMPTEGSR